MELKPGVRIFGIQSELVLALIIADGVFGVQDQKLVITSLMDGQHMRGSLHYVGAAADLRLPTFNAPTIVGQLSDFLGADFDVVLESDHIYIEFQPKIRY